MDSSRESAHARRAAGRPSRRTAGDPAGGSLPHGERRSGRDRRARPTRLLSRHAFVGRRRGGRRAGEQRDLYVDRYTVAEWSLVLGAVSLCALDLVLTLDVVARGGSEWNPLMALALGHGVVTFVAVKMGVTALGMTLLLVRIRFGRTRVIVATIVVLYCLLIAYHGVLRATGSAVPETVAAVPAQSG